MKRYRLSREANQDIVDILEYVAGKAGLPAAQRLGESIIDTIIILAVHPNAGRREECFGPGVFSFPKRNYKIYYSKRRGGIVVLHIFHGSRDQGKARKM